MCDSTFHFSQGSCHPFPEWKTYFYMIAVLVRFAQSNQAGVEMVGMDLGDRSRLKDSSPFHGRRGNTASPAAPRLNKFRREFMVAA